MWEFKGVKVHWLGHDSFVLQGSKTVVIDPFKAKGDYKADILLISHEHSDHLSEDDISRFTTPSTSVVAAQVCQDQLQKFTFAKKFVQPGARFEIQGVGIETVPAYNLNKFREPGKVFHPRDDGRVGYIVTLDGARFYHSGDSDATDEMKALDADVAFLPVSGTYVMTADEAAEAAKAMNVKVFVPMHYDSIVGTRKDAERFRDLVSPFKTVEVLEKE